MRLLRSIRWLWNRLHPFTWVIVAVAAAALVLIVVPGEGIDVYDFDFTGAQFWAFDGLLDDYPSQYTEIHLHGWPYSGVARCVLYDQWPSATYTYGNPPPPPPPPTRYWTEAKSWPLEADKWLVSWPTVVLDAVICLALVFAVGALAEVWILRRGGKFRLRIVDFLAMFTVVAMLVAWYQYHVRLQRTELRVANYFETSHHGTLNRQNGSLLPYATLDPHTEYCGPEWLRRLVGNEALLPTLHHVRSAHLQVSTQWHDDIDQLGRLPYLRGVCLTGILPIGMVEELAKFPRLESLELQFYIHTDTAGSSIRDWDALPAREVIQPWELDALGALSLRELSLCSDEILAEDIDRICSAMPNLETLWLQNLPLTDAEVDELRLQYPKLIRHPVWNRSSPQVELLRDEVIRRRADIRSAK